MQESQSVLSYKLNIADKPTSMKKLNCVALVDDDEITNFLNQRVVSELDFANNVKVFSNGKEILDHMKEATEKPELILLDINMPVMNGFEFLKAHKLLKDSQKANVIIIMLTSSLLEKDMEMAKELEITEFVPKPLSKEKLEEVVAKYFN